MRQNLLHFIFIFLCINIILSSVLSQDCNSWIDYDQEKHDWYEREEGIAKFILYILNDNPNAAIDSANKHPGDAEGYFLKAVAYAHKGDNTAAIENVNLSLNARLPFERYLTGSSDLMDPLINMSEFEAIANEKNIKLVHGPMPGVVTDVSAKFWARTNGEMSFKVILSTDNSFSSTISSNTVTTSSDDENTGVAEATGLSQSTQYYYKLVLDGSTQEKVYSFKTYPTKGESAQFSIAFGGGSAYIPWKSEMWNVIGQHDVLAFLQLGDNVYIDYPAETEVQQYCYYRRQSESCYRDLISGTNIYAIWDDHDFGDDDSYGQSSKIKPYGPQIYETFTHQWNNPYYGGGSSNPGCWFDASIADVDYFFLDGRYYREKTGTMLGSIQKQWLKDKLKASTATFKVIATPVPFAEGVKPGDNDPWDGYPTERQEIYDFIADENINGVVLIAADRHRHDCWKIPNDNSYPMYEFMSSKITNLASHACMDDSDVEWCTTGNAFGKLTFNTTLNDPTVTYEVYDEDNDKYSESTTLKLSELTSVVGTQYSLSVENGSGDGNYNSGKQVNISADNPPTGKKFDKWTGDVSKVSDVNSSNTTITMPSANASISATYVSTGGGLDSPEIAINFQPAGYTTPQGYLADEGLAFGDRGNYNYGWDATYIDNTRDRDEADVEDKYNTQIKLKDGEIWEIELPNGTYDLYVVFGDAKYTDAINTVDIEGTVVNDPVVGNNFDEYTLSVEVKDGRLTIKEAPGGQPKINFIEISAGSGGSNPTYILSVSNGSGDGSYEEGASVNIYANSPDSGFEFDKWTGDTDNIADVNAANTTITMPSKAISITANYTSIGTTTYTLTVENGIGDGDYEAGEKVNIIANAPETGYVFNEWTGVVANVANVSSSNTTFSMPAQNALITANFIKSGAEVYDLEIVNGYGSGVYLAGAMVTISAEDPPVGYVFYSWTGDTNFIDEVNESEQLLIMPSQDLSLIALYGLLSGTSYNFNKGKTLEFMFHSSSTNLSIDLRDIGHSTINIYNLFGQSVYSKRSDNLIQKINIHNLKGGVYILKVVDDRNVVYSQKIIIK